MGSVEGLASVAHFRGEPSRLDSKRARPGRRAVTDPKDSRSLWERLDDTDKILFEMRQAVREALGQHKRAGNPAGHGHQPSGTQEDVHAAPFRQSRRLTLKRTVEKPMRNREDAHETHPVGAGATSYHRRTSRLRLPCRAGQTRPTRSTSPP